MLSKTLPYAIGIATSPFPILPAILLLFAPRARLTSLSYLLGWLVGIVLVTAAFVLLAEVFPARGDHPPVWASCVRIALGATLIVLGVRAWLHRKGKEVPAWMHSLQSASPTKAIELGLLLSVVNPKTSLLAAAAGLAIGAEDSRLAVAACPIAVFTLVASIGVGLPILLYVVIGEPVRRPLAKARDWLERNNHAVTGVVIVVIGGILLWKGGHALLR